MRDKDSEALGDALQRLKAADATMRTSSAVEVRLRREVRALAGRSRPWTAGTIAALAAAVIICVWVPTHWVLSNPEIPGISSTPPASRSVTTEFFPLFYGSLPASSTHIVRMEVPRAALTQFGLMSADAGGEITGMVLADVLFGDDGLARAVRFVRPLSQE